MENKKENIVLAICGVCAIAVTVAYIIFGYNYLKQPTYDRYDTNQDGVVDVRDAMAVQRYIVEEQLQNAPEGGFITVTGIKTDN